MSSDSGDGERSRPWSPVAAGLLNLTTLVLGLRLHVAVAARRDPRRRLDRPGGCRVGDRRGELPWLWRAMAAVWLGWMALRMAAGPPRGALQGARQQWVPSAVSVVLVTAVVGGYLLYGAAGRSVYATGIAAQGRADGATAIIRYDAVTAPYQLTLSRHVPARRRAQCTAFEAASLAEGNGACADAVSRYQDYRRTYPAVERVPLVHEELKRSYIAWAWSLRRARDYPAAIRAYRSLLAESRSDPGAAQVRDELAATYFEQVEVARASLPTSSSGQRVELARTAVDVLLVIQRELGDTAPVHDAAHHGLGGVEVVSGLGGGQQRLAAPVADLGLITTERQEPSASQSRTGRVRVAETPPQQRRPGRAGLLPGLIAVEFRTGLTSNSNK